MIKSFDFIISRIKERVSLLLWSRILFSFSVKKDLSKIFLFLLKAIEKILKIFNSFKLFGLLYSLKKFRPKIIIEIHSERLRKKTIELLKDFGYRLVYEKLKKDTGFYLSYFK